MNKWDYVKGLIEKHKARKGYKSKIIAKCIECIADPCDTGTWRQQVEACNSTDCPLHEVRPTTTVDK